MMSDDVSQGVVVVALATNDIIQMISFFRLGTIEAQNVSYWRVNALSGAGTDAQYAAVYQYGMMTIADVENLMTPSAVNYRTLFNNLTKVGEFGEWLQDFPGVAAGDNLPTFNAASIKQIVPTRLTRNGYKRIPFIAEGLNTGGVLTISAPIRTALEAFFGSAVTVNYTIPSGPALSLTLEPVVIGRSLVGGVYVLDMAKVQDVTNAEVQQRITSQNSRKS